jgi:DNA-binding transcriptional LysR family regulator
LRRFTGFTADGEIILRYARRIVGEVNDFRLAVANHGNGEGTTIRLGSVPSTLVTASLFTQELHKSYPQLSVTVQVQSAPALHRMVQSDHLTAAICYAAPARQEGLLVTTLYRERYNLVLPTSWQWTIATHAEWGELANLPLGLLESGYQFRAIIEEALAAAGVQPKVAVESNSMSALLTQASIGDCAAIVPSMFLKILPAPACVRVVPLSEPKVGYSVCLIVNRSRAATQFGQTIMAVGRSIKPALEDIGSRKVVS